MRARHGTALFAVWNPHRSMKAFSGSEHPKVRHLSIGTVLCNYGIAYRRACGLSIFRSFKKPRERPLCGGFNLKFTFCVEPFPSPTHLDVLRVPFVPDVLLADALRRMLGCSPVFYTPRAQNAPNAKQKSEMKSLRCRD